MTPVRTPDDAYQAGWQAGLLLPSPGPAQVAAVAAILAPWAQAGQAAA